LPQAPAEVTLACHLPQADALALLHRWGAQPLPLNASCWVNDQHGQAAQDMLFVRLRGAVAAVHAAVPRMCADVAALGGQRRSHRSNTSAKPIGPLAAIKRLPFFTPSAADMALVALEPAANRTGVGPALCAMH
jgi:glycolate oxidase FAD binding subunit